MQQIMDTLAMDILTNLTKQHTDYERGTTMSDTDNDFLQTSWHFDRATGKDVAKVCFVFDGIASVSPDATTEEHERVMRDATQKCSRLVSDVAATFGSLAHTRSLRYMAWLIDKEINCRNDSMREAYKESRIKFHDVVCEAI